MSSSREAYPFRRRRAAVKCVIVSAEPTPPSLISGRTHGPSVRSFVSRWLALLPSLSPGDFLMTTVKGADGEDSAGREDGGGGG